MELKMEGKLRSNHCKPVLCVEEGKVYSSVTDAANAIGAYAPDVSNCINGKKRMLKGKHFINANDKDACLAALLLQVERTGTTIAELREKANAWDALEAKRKADEARAARIKALEQENEALLLKMQKNSRELDALQDEVIACK